MPEKFPRAGGSEDILSLPVNVGGHVNLSRCAVWVASDGTQREPVINVAKTEYDLVVEKTCAVITVAIKDDISLDDINRIGRVEVACDSDGSGEWLVARVASEVDTGVGLKTASAIHR